MIYDEFNKINAKLEEHDQFFKGIYKEFGKFEYRLDEYDKKFADNDKKMDKKFAEYDKKMDQKFEEFEKKLDEKLDQKLDEKLGQFSKEIASELHNMMEVISISQQKLIEKFHNEIKENNKKHYEKFNKMDDRLDCFEERLQDNERELEILKTKM